jgi:hypothetical protein
LRVARYGLRVLGFGLARRLPAVFVAGYEMRGMLVKHRGYRSRPRNPHTNHTSATPQITPDTRPVASIPPASQIWLPINEPMTRPKPAAAKKPDIIVARDVGNNSVDRDNDETMVNSKIKKRTNRLLKARGKVCDERRKRGHAIPADR